MSDESLSWTVRLSDSAPQKRIVVFLASVTVLMVGIVLFKSVSLGVIGAAAILASTAEFWLGVKYSVTDVEAKRQCGASISGIRFEDVKRVVLEGNHVKLSPLAESGRLDAFRGVTLVTTNANHDRVMELLRERLKDVRFLGD